MTNSCICSFFPMTSMSSTYIIMMHTPSSFSLNSMQRSTGLTWNPKGYCFVMFMNFSKTVWLLSTDHISPSVVGSSLLVMILDQFPPFPQVISSLSPYRKAVSTSITRLSNFATIILASAILKDTSCATVTEICPSRRVGHFSAPC